MIMNSTETGQTRAVFLILVQHVGTGCMNKPLSLKCVAPPSSITILYEGSYISQPIGMEGQSS